MTKTCPECLRPLSAIPLFGLANLKLAEVTHWGSSSRLRFTGRGPGGFRLEVKFDLPLTEVEITDPDRSFSIDVSQQED